VRSGGRQLALPVLPCARREDLVQDVWGTVGQNLAAEREKVMRLAEVRDPQPVPALEQPVRIAGDPRPVALYQEHPAAVSMVGKFFQPRAMLSVTVGGLSRPACAAATARPPMRVAAARSSQRG
jgi:hypothetical protein